MNDGQIYIYIYICHFRKCLEFPQMPSHLSHFNIGKKIFKNHKFPQLPRHFRNFHNWLVISGNARFPQLPATYIYLPFWRNQDLFALSCHYAVYWPMGSHMTSSDSDAAMTSLDSEAVKSYLKTPTLEPFPSTCRSRC